MILIDIVIFCKGKDYMKLGLHISKNYNMKSYANGRHIGFAVVDLDKSGEYPANYLCILPRIINPKVSQQSKFSKLFGEKSKEIAKNLLTQALDGEEDLEVRKEIRNRLKRLDPKKGTKTFCSNCGKAFEQNLRKFRRHKLCRECYQQKYRRNL